MYRIYSPKDLDNTSLNIIEVTIPIITHYFITTVVCALLDEASTSSYRVIISESNNDPVKQTEILKTMIQFGIDIILPSLRKND